jgi:GNAT superfamily N-acetyltransferase
VTGPRSGRRGVRPARDGDLAALVEIERSAGETFRSLGMDRVADDDPGSVEQLTPYAEGGRAFVAVDQDDRPVAYLLLDLVDGNAHIEQVSVHPRHAGHGIGRELVEHAAAWAEQRALPALTLTTYLDVPWNGPYYERLGFRHVGADEETPGLRALRAHERAVGLDAWPRGCMRRDLQVGR